MQGNRQMLRILGPLLLLASPLHAATLYAIYDNATGELVSTGTVVASQDVLTGLNRTAIATEYEDKLPPYVAWDKVTHSFVAFSPPRPVISKTELLEKFTVNEFEALMAFPTGNTGTAGQKRTVAAIIKQLEWREQIDLNLQRVQDAINFLETVGIIGAGRAAQIIG
jgi:hypothetical protein